MHEFSIAQSIAKTVEKNFGHRRQAKKILVKIGILSGVDKGALEFCWPLVIENDIHLNFLKNSELNIELIKIKAVCKKCQQIIKIEKTYQMRCPFCSELVSEIISGNELRIKSVFFDI